MKFGFTESLCDPSHITPLAVLADQRGYDFFYIPDSICYPAEAAGKYPYTETGDRDFLETAPFIESFCLASALAAVTERIRLATFVLKLPIREPVHVAKQTASVAALSGDRFELGVGLSPWIEDFQVCNQQWERRGKRMDEMIEIIRGLMAVAHPDWYEHKGEFYELQKMRINPIPGEPVKIHIGGTSDPALKRAARVGDGWMYAGFDQEHMKACIAKLSEFRKEYGRDHLPFAIHAPPLGVKGFDDFEKLPELGITHCMLGPRNCYEPDTMTLQQKLDACNAIADSVLPKFQD